MKEVIFEVPVLLPTLNQYSRWHWTKQRKCTEDMSAMVKEALGLKFIREHKAFEKCIVVVERHSTKDPKDMDWDNIFTGLKPVLDSLTVRHKHGNGIIDDDSTRCIVSTPTIIPVKCKKGDEKAVIKVIEVT